MDYFREFRFEKEVFFLYNRESKALCADSENPDVCLEKRKLAFNAIRDTFKEHRLNEIEGKKILLDRQREFGDRF